jgi:hypothetical protein
MLDVFGDTPTENQYGPPSTSFSNEQHPLGAAAFGSLRSPSLRRTQRVFGEAAVSPPPRRALSRGRPRRNLQKDFYTPKSYKLPVELTLTSVTGAFPFSTR